MQVNIFSIWLKWEWIDVRLKKFLFSEKNEIILQILETHTARMSKNEFELQLQVQFPTRSIFIASAYNCKGMRYEEHDT